MRVMVLIKATEQSEAGQMPSQELLEQMTDFNEELVRAGVMLAGEGLHPSSEGVRVVFSGSERRVIDGPFAETKELVAGFWIWKCKSKEEAIEWVKRCPNPQSDKPVYIELAMTKRVLAAELGTISETFSRTLASLRQRKLIAVKGKTITVLSPLALNNLLRRNLGE